MRKESQERGMPCNLDAERYVLGGVLSDPAECSLIVSGLDFEDFLLHKHRLIFDAIKFLVTNGETVDRVTVANRLMATGQLEKVDGLTYLVSLDDGLPTMANLGAYARIVKDKAALRRLIAESQRTIDRAMSGAESSDSIGSDYSSNIDKIVGSAHSKSNLVQPKEVIERYGGLEVYMNGRPPGLSTGFVRLDEMTYGLQPEEVMIVAARPSMGKTALALNVAQNVAIQQKKHVALFSLEMSNLSLVDRMACSIARVNAQLFRRGDLGADEKARLRKAIHQIAFAPLYLSDAAGESVMSISSEVRQLKKEKGLDLVVIDYLQLLSSSHGSRRENRQQEVSDISRQLKLLAKSLGIPFVVLSQLSRATEGRADKRPVMSDLRESGSIEQDADLVAFLYRDEIYNPREDNRGTAELILSKQRNGPIGTVDLVYLKEFTRFENRAADMEGWGAAA